MTQIHLGMAELVALRDSDRSEPEFVLAQDHLERCPTCRSELARLHQRTAHLRALPQLTPSVNVYPAVQRSVAELRGQQIWRRGVSLGLAAAAALVLWVVGSNLAHPAPLNAMQEIAEAKSSSRQIEQRLAEWNPDQRSLDGRTIIVVIGLEDRIAEVDREIQVIESASLNQSAPTVIIRSSGISQEQLEQTLRLWRERERLMDALLKVHVNRAAQIEF